MVEVLIVSETDYAALSHVAAPAALQRELARAIVVSDEAMPADVVRLDSLVRYVDESTGERGEVHVVHPQHADAAPACVSVLAPVGTALFGLSAGQAIAWTFPDGSHRRLRVEEVRGLRHARR